MTTEDPDQNDGDLAGRVAHFIATGFGSGRSPVAPGTAGSVVALPFAWLMTNFSWPGQLLTLGAVTVLAIWSAGLAAQRLGIKDPGEIVVDEIAGLLMSVLFFPADWRVLLLGFLLFRVFDITKPPPCRRAEALPGGLGIVADDLCAGLYSNLALSGLCAAGILSL